ncbi:MAG: sodium:proton antiporter [Verrucomicrobiota bacterium]|jgi:Na+/H+ antiporter NhaD/arsenite permease-like protein
MILPFALWLLLIALAPHYLPLWWARHYGKLALLLAAATVGYYLFVLPPEASQTVLHAAHDYFSFIVLIGSLYVVSSGIRISIRGEGGPGRNVCFLALGGLAANVLGTTGASVLLIRPWLQLNQSRLAPHHVVFFIFIVANIGGGLTPIGDPPLLLGFLKGVPFWWVAQHCWPAWLVSMGLLLGAFYVIDRRHYVPSIREPLDEAVFVGWWNVFFLAVIVAAVFVERPEFLREGLMLAAAAASFLTTGEKIHQENQFSFGPMLEVAVLFFGIFATMMPALDWLQINARSILGANPSPGLVYWSSGGLSSVLDSAPAYLAFASALSGVFAGMASLPQTGAAHLAALSIATVFFGAATYLGNGPNLMIKAIAERQGAPLPTFPGYVFKWAVPILLPLLLIVWLVFVRW